MPEFKPFNPKKLAGKIPAARKNIGSQDFKDGVLLPKRLSVTGNVMRSVWRSQIYPLLHSGLTIRRLANLLGVSPMTICRWKKISEDAAVPIRLPRKKEDDE